MKPIVCTECKKRILKRNDLVVAGKLLQPYHKICFEEPSSTIGKVHAFYGAFPTGIRCLLVIIVGNGILFHFLKTDPRSFLIIVIFGILFNGVFIGARIGIYLCYERYLKE